MGRVFIFCFYFQRFKNITQTSSILLFWQTNNTIGRIVHGTICLECNCTLKLTRTVFSRVAMLNFYFRFQLISHSNVCHRHTWKLKFGNQFEFFFLQKYGASTKILRGLRCLRTRTFILFGLRILFYSWICSSGFTVLLFYI